jgi:RNA polymerase sigma factor (sigma-70 family)
LRRVSNTARSYEVFFDEYYEHVRRALAVAFADPVLAEDSAQDAFARAYVHWRSVSMMERPAGWVYVVALRGGRRQRSRRVETVAPEPVPEPDPVPTLVERDELDEMLRRLPERQRIAIVLRYLADLPIADVAAAMGCAVGTVKSTLHAALTRLRVELHDLDEESWSDARG